jgi:hypothetical protein
MNPVYASEVYLRNKAIHEQTCAEITYPKRMYVIKDEDGDVQFVNKTDVAHYFLTDYLEPGVQFAPSNKNERFIDQWLEDPERLVCEKVVVDPASPLGPTPMGYNLWTGFAASKLPPVQDAEVEELVRVMVRHINDVYAGANNERRTIWLLNWLAHQVQFPQTRHGVGVVMYGESMTGRGILARFHRMVLGSDTSYHAKFGRKYRHLESTLVGDAGKIFVQVKTQPQQVKRVSVLLAKRTVDFKRKFFSTTQVANLTNLYVTTDVEKDFRFYSDDGRFAVFNVNPMYKANHAYFDQMWEHLNRPEVQRAWYQFLMARDLSQFQVGSLPPPLDAA